MKKQDKKNLNTIGSKAAEALEKASEAISKEEFDAFKKKMKQTTWTVICGAGLFLATFSLYWDYLAAQLQQSRFMSISFHDDFGGIQKWAFLIGWAVMGIASWRIPKDK